MRLPVCAVLAAFVLPGLEPTPAIVTGLAAGSAAVLRAPFFGALFATLMAGSAAAETVPLAILGAVIGWLIAVFFDPEAASETTGEEA